MNSALYRVFLIILSLLFSSYSTTTFSQQVTQISPSSAGVQLESDSFLYWLHFDQDANSLWPLLKQFWEKEGIAITEEKPQLGFMQTEWINEPEISKFNAIIFSDSAPEFRERFRLRVEQLPDNKGSRVYIHHSSYGILLDDEAVYTGYLPASPELEIEMLSRLALFAGADKNLLKKTTSTYKPVRLQANAIGNNQFEIIMPGSIDFVRKKVIEALDRLNTNLKTQADGSIIASNSDSSVLTDKNTEKEQESWGIDDSSELEEEGFSYNPDDKTSKEQPDVYTIKLTRDKSVININIRAHTGSNQHELEKFSKAVARKLNR